MFHVNIDSNEITNAIVLKVENVIYAVLRHLINIISSFVFLIIILITILLINFNVKNIFKEGQKTYVNEQYRQLPEY